MPKLENCLKIRVNRPSQAQRLTPTCPECGEPLHPGTFSCGTTTLETEVKHGRG